MRRKSGRPPRDRSGAFAEWLAARHLCARGLRLLTRNYRCPHGEIDLIMLEAEVLVFVEIKYRHDERWMPAAASIHPHQQRRIGRAGAHYLQYHGASLSYLDCRFDAVLLVGHLLWPRIEWIKHAFAV